MTAQGLWSSPAGKTPAATLYASLLRLIRAKGDQAKFKKVARGRFTLA
jgi:mevalonate pyrophosphate decarboxylase